MGFIATIFPVLAVSLPEILGLGGETFALDDPAELAALLRCAATDTAFRPDLATRARERSALFSWDRAARETTAVYEQVMRR